LEQLSRAQIGIFVKVSCGGEGKVVTAVTIVKYVPVAKMAMVSALVKPLMSPALTTALGLFHWPLPRTHPSRIHSQEVPKHIGLLALQEGSKCFFSLLVLMMKCESLCAKK